MAAFSTQFADRMFDGVPHAKHLCSLLQSTIRKV